MKRIPALCLCVVLAAASLVPSGASAAPSRPDRRTIVPALSRLNPAHAANRVPGEVVVRYRTTADRADKVELRSDVEAESVETLELPRAEVLEVAGGTVDAAIAELESSPDVLYAEPNFYYSVSATTTPNDPRFAQEWGLNNTGQSIAGAFGTNDADIDAPEAWGYSTGNSSTIVAIIDSGVAYDHPDLASNIWTNPGETGSGKESNGLDDDGNGLTDDWRGWDYVDNDNGPRDLLGHGTHVAGTVGAVGNDGFGVTGVSWDVSLMALRVLDGEGSGSTSDVASAISYAAAKGADVINLSLGGPDLSLSVSNAIAAASNTLVVVAAGNEGSNNDVVASYPCNYQAANIVCVAASDQNDALAGYSNYGVGNVDIAAPGSRVLSTVPAFARALRETFEADISTSWTTGGVGTPWSRSSDSLGYFIADSVGANYVDNTDSWIKTTSPISLASQGNCRVTYAFELETENNGDFLEVEVSTDGTSWTHVGGWTGSTGGDWLSASHDISGFDGQSIYLRFRLISNGFLNYDGASIDQVEIRCLSGFSGSEFSYFSGTSMATPHVAGAAALLVSMTPTASVASLRSALLGGTDALTSMIGKTATGGRLNVAKAISVVVPTAVPTTNPSSSPSPTADPTPTPTPSDSATPTPTPSPTESIEPPVDLGHERSVNIRLSGHLRVHGQLTVADDFTSCIAGVAIKIKRNGVFLKSITTDNSGAFIASLRDRTGRYTARAPGFDVLGGRCRNATAPVRRHRHV